MALSLLELQKAQAESEGFQNGPYPALNPANLNTQDALGNTQIPTTSPVPYYPPKETPNLQMSTGDMSPQLANNFVILDSLFPTGGNPVVAALVISARIQELNATTARSVSLTATDTQMYAVSLYMSAIGTAAAGHAATCTISYTDVLGAETIVVTMPLDTRNIVMETYPLLVIGGTSVTLSTAYAGGATNDPYNISARLVQMP